MVTAADIGKQVAYVVDGQVAVVGRMTALSRDTHWAEITETVGDNLKRLDEYLAVLCEVVP